MRNNEIQNEMYKMKKFEGKIKRQDVKYKMNKYTYDFQQFEMIRSFSGNSYSGKISIDEADMDQSNLLENMVEFNNKSRPIITESNNKKRNTFDSVSDLYEGQELILNACNSGIFPIKAWHEKGPKILTPKQFLQRFLIALAQVKVGNNLENLLNEITQIVYSLYQSKKIIKKVYNNILNN